MFKHVSEFLYDPAQVASLPLLPDPSGQSYDWFAGSEHLVQLAVKRFLMVTGGAVYVGFGPELYSVRSRLGVHRFQASYAFMRRDEGPPLAYYCDIGDETASSMPLGVPFLYQYSFALNDVELRVVAPPIDEAERRRVDRLSHLKFHQFRG